MANLYTFYRPTIVLLIVSELKSTTGCTHEYKTKSLASRPLDYLIIEGKYLLTHILSILAIKDATKLFYAFREIFLNPKPALPILKAILFRMGTIGIEHQLWLRQSRSRWFSSRSLEQSKLTDDV